MSTTTVYLGPVPQRHRLTSVVIPEEATDGSLVYRAEIPELPGCMSHGDTEEEALQNLQEALDLYMETVLSREPRVIMMDMPMTSGTMVLGALRPKAAPGHIESKVVVVDEQ
jgi:predicted RNase H-like HicB family nuclease